MKVTIKDTEAVRRRIARLPAVKAEVVAHTGRLAEIARGNLAAASDGRGRHQIVTRFGVADGYVELDGPAAAQLEFGRAAQEPGSDGARYGTGPQAAKHIMLRSLIEGVIG